MRREIDLLQYIPLPACYDAVCAATSRGSRLCTISAGFWGCLRLDGIRGVVRRNRRFFVSVTPIHLAKGNVIVHERLHAVRNLNTVELLLRRVIRDSGDRPS